MNKAWQIRCYLLPNAQFRMKLIYRGKHIGTLYRKFWEANEWYDMLEDDPNVEFVTDTEQ